MSEDQDPYRENELYDSRDSIYITLRNTVRKLDAARNILRSLEDKYYEQKNEFESTDRKLAMIDGRYQRIERARSSAKDKKDNVKIIAKLTNDQILRIAEALGVEVEVEG